MNGFKIWGIALCAAALMFGATKCAHAHSFNEADCQGLAGTVVEMGTNRDQGYAKSEVSAVVEVRLAEAFGQPDTFIHDAEDVMLVRKLLDWAYDHPKVTPQQLHGQVLFACLPRPKAKKGVRHVSRS